MKLEFWILFQTLLCYTSADHLWKGPILVPKVLINLNIAPYSKFVSSSELKFQCGCSCDRLDWCSTWCFNEVNKTCFKSTAVLSPLYVTTTITNYDCYTYQEPDFIVGANVTSPPPPPAISNRYPSNLAKGIYNFYDIMTCGLASATSPWMLFDLKLPQIIHEIKITTQYYVNALEMPNGAEVRVSISSPVGLGNFSNFDLLGTFANPTQPMTTFSFKTGKGMKVQYISIQKFNSNNMVVCRVTAI